VKNIAVSHLPGTPAPVTTLEEYIMTVATSQVKTQQPTNYLNTDYNFLSWLFTLDHKRIAIMYLGAISLFMALGVLAAAALRFELLTPVAGGMAGDIFKRVYTIHGFLMVFLGLLPAVPAILGNFLIPLMIGARNLAFPRLNLTGFYLYLLGGLLVMGSIIFGGVDTGWIFYAPGTGNVTSAAILLTGLGLVAASASLTLLAINLVTTIHKMRAPGLFWFQLPIFVWAIYLTSWMVLVGTPLMVAATLLVLMESLLEWDIFSPAVGGDPVLFEHLFWFYGNQITFAILLPAIGIICEIFSAFSRRRIFGYRVVIYAMVAIALLGFVSWPIQMINSNIALFTAFLGSFLSFLTIVPFMVIIFSLIATMYKADIRFSGPVMFALAATILILIGGISQGFLSSLPLAKYLQGTIL
jgi:cytochrome c oxidase subunit 1